MFRFGVQNLRSLRNVGPLEIRPITVLVGRNSSGKSTFLRAFPLIRQSLMTRTSSPILWWGDLVDFGDYETAISNGAQDKKITFKFGLDEVFVPRLSTMSLNEATMVRNVEVSLSVSHQSGKGRLESLSMAYENRAVRFDVKLDHNGDVSELLFNDNSAMRFLDSVKLGFMTGNIFPEFQLRSKKEGLQQYIVDPISWFASALVNTIKPYVSKRIGVRTLHRFSFLISGMSEFSNSELSRVQGMSIPNGLRDIIEDIKSNNSLGIKSQVQTMFELQRWMRFYPAVIQSLRSILSSSLYIGPVRAQTERYYRYQDLAVSEIDPDGKNFPMFLNSLSPDRMQDFSDWVSARFGYGVKVNQYQGHISIALKVGQRTTNIVDTGYGISQVLPVLGQIWWASRRAGRWVPRRPTISLLVIEQPELHLHPAHQALIADAIVSERQQPQLETRPKLQFVIETHSEALINRLGELIAAQRVPAEDVQVIVFDADDDEEERETRVRVSHFTPDGTLTNWPYGFFQPGSVK